MEYVVQEFWEIWSTLRRTQDVRKPHDFLVRPLQK